MECSGRTRGIHPRGWGMEVCHHAIFPEERIPEQVLFKGLGESHFSRQYFFINIKTAS